MGPQGWAISEDNEQGATLTSGLISELQGRCRQTALASLTEPRGYKVLEREGPRTSGPQGVLNISWNPAMTPIHSSFDSITGDGR